MPPRRIARKDRGPGLQTSTTFPAPDVADLDRAAAIKGMTRASFIYRATMADVRRTLRHDEMQAPARCAAS